MGEPNVKLSRNTTRDDPGILKPVVEACAFTFRYVFSERFNHRETRFMSVSRVHGSLSGARHKETRASFKLFNDYASLHSESCLSLETLNAAFCYHLDLTALLNTNAMA